RLSGSVGTCGFIRGCPKRAPARYLSSRFGSPALARLGHAWEETLERFFADTRSRFSDLPVLAVTQDSYVHRRVGAIMRKVGEVAKGTGSAEASVSCVL